ncbi:MAG: glycolate oxidase subunit GlcF [Thioalkalispiraceae bacterium]|jgi:glycolate oxidase iron-sulfur subunit
MQTRLSKSIKATHWGQNADRILRSCVHCGFCTATCPTYQLLGDELDGPRGRIYQIKEFLENGRGSRIVQSHLDRCLTCRSCETTCPSGVEYGHLLDIGREQLEKTITRPVHQRLMRLLLRKTFTNQTMFRLLVGVAQTFRAVLPDQLKKQLPDPHARLEVPTVEPASLSRKMLLLDGCVQSALSPEINAASRRILNQLGIELISADGCCGAIEHHLSATDSARQRIKQNIDHWWQYLADGAEAIVSTASGCGVMVKDYDALIADDPDYVEKARIIVERTRDISEVIHAELDNISLSRQSLPAITFHSPCTLQHGQKLNGQVENILSKLGFKLGPVADAHLCCGSAGTYSILQKSIATRLRDNKLAALQQSSPQVIATANIGCLLHLRSGTNTRVLHWINLLDEYISAESRL